MYNVKSNTNLILAGLALGALTLLTIGCGGGRDLESAYYAQESKRIYHTDLYTQPTVGIHSYQRGRTARVEGHSPLTSDVFLLNAEQKAAISELNAAREERAKANF